MKKIISIVFLASILLVGCTKQKDKDTYVEINPSDLISDKIQGVEVKRHKFSVYTLLNEYLNLSNEDANQFVLSVKENPDKTEPFYYVGIARDIFNQDKDTAAVMFLYAQMRSAQDANCCLDKTAFEFVNNLPNYAPNVSNYLAGITNQKYSELLKKAFELDNKYKERVSPIWACYNGKSALEDKIIETYPKEDWEKLREEIKAEYRKKL